MNILLTAVGRRPYLVEWFQEALSSQGIEGKVIAADLDPYSPARSFADVFLEAPRADSPEYQPWLKATLQDYDVALAISINDFELSTWSRLPKGAPWDALVRLEPAVQNLVEDKVTMNKALQAANIPTPKTWIGSQASTAAETHEGDFITKGRFGSASRGLRFTTSDELADVVNEVTTEVTDRDGRPALDQTEHAPEDLVLIQEKIDGIEYGLDVVCDLNGAYAGVIARQKLSMRAGETDRAVSVDGARFNELAEKVAKAVPHIGTMDIDVLVDEAGMPYVIDINPRFGGGYPLSHVAGADTPSAYVAWASSKDAPTGWNEVAEGTVAGKYVGVATA